VVIEKSRARKPVARDLTSEAAPRALDPFEQDYMGVIRGNDPLLRARGVNIEAYIDLMRDGKVYASIGRRVAALVSRPWAVAPVREGDTASAEALTEILKRLPFDQLCRDLLQALITGYSVVEVIWDVVEGQWIPSRFPVRRPTRFVYVDEGDGLTLRLLTARDMLRGEPLPDRKFIVHRFEPRDDNPYGTGLGLYLFWPVYFKRRGVSAWAKFCDRFGTPTPWGRYPAGSEPKDKATLASALRAFSSDGYIMTPEGALIELLEASGGGNVTTQEALVRAMDNAIAEIILGQESGQSSGGALAAAAKERADVRLDLVQADSELLSETLNRTLIAWLCEFHGLGPCSISRQIKEEVDLKAAAEADAIVAGMGFALSEEAVRAKYGDGWSAAAPVPDEAATTGEGAPEGAQAKRGGEAEKYDAGLINAYSIGVDRLARLGVEIPVDFVRGVFGLPAPKGGEKILMPPATESPAFAETDASGGGSMGDIATRLAGRVQQESDPVIAGWLQTIEAMLGAAGSLDEFRQMLLTAFPELDSDALTNTLAPAFAVAQLRGRVSVEDEA
jgi:phage gp29-like protein